MVVQLRTIFFVPAVVAFSIPFFVALSGVFLLPVIASAQSVPAMPTFTSYVDAAVGTSSCAIALHWSQDSGTVPGSFGIRDESGEFFLPNPYDPASLGDFRYTYPNRTPNTEYTYRLRACSTIGGGSCSSYTGFTSATTKPLPSLVPPAPTIIGGGSSDDPNALPTLAISWDPGVTWEDVAWANTAPYRGFDVLRAESSNGATYSGYRTIAQNLPPRTPVQHDDTADPDFSYKYKVVAYQSGGIGCDLENRTITRFSPDSSELVVPVRPSDVLATLAASSSETIALSWTDVARGGGNETLYEVWRSTTGSNGPFVLAKTTASNATGAADVCGANSVCFYAVRACRTNACSPFSPVIVGSTGLRAPSDLRAQIVNYNATTRRAKVRLEWTSNSEGVEAGYVVKMATGAGAFTTISDGTCDAGLAGKESFPADPETDFTVPSGTTYRFAVAACGGSVVSSDSNVTGINAKFSLSLRGQSFASMSGSGVGWVNFNSKSEPLGVATLEYSAQVDDSGLVSGLTAGSADSWGWLSFNRDDLRGCPEAPCEARLDFNTRQVSGWARFLAPVWQTKTSGYNARYWEGWVRLRGTVQTQQEAPKPGDGDKQRTSFQNNTSEENSFARVLSPFRFFGGLIPQAFSATTRQSITPPPPTNPLASSTYGILYDDVVRTFKNVAWGGNVVGWMVLSNEACTESGAPCVVYADDVGEAPRVTSVTLSNSDFCSDQPMYRVAWAFDDRGTGAAQTRADVEFVDLANASRVFYRTSVSGNTVVEVNDPIGNIGPYTSFRVRVRATNAYGTSPWTSSGEARTPLTYPPLVDFLVQPLRITTSTVVRFTDTSVDRSRGTRPPLQWKWEFAHGIPAVVNTQNATTTFTVLPSSAMLVVNNECAATQDITGTSSSTPRRRLFIQER